MKLDMRPFTVLFLVVAACVPAGEVGTEAPRASRPSSGFEVGQPFPTLAFPSLEDGTPSSIADFAGKKLILHVFASW